MVERRGQTWWEQAEEKGRSEGVELGRAEGAELGRAEGRREGLRELLRFQLASSIEGELPSWADERINRANEEDIRRWSRKLLADSTSLEEILIP